MECSIGLYMMDNDSSSAFYASKYARNPNTERLWSVFNDRILNIIVNDL